MNELEKQLLAALNELEETVRTLATAPSKPDLLTLFTRIDGLAAQLPAADPELRHYLQKKSYTKAREHLLGRGARVERGTCGH